MAYRISVDTGGTFTDVVVVDDNGQLRIGKALTTPRRAFEGISAALDTVAPEFGLSAGALLADAETFTYGTTRATNANDGDSRLNLRLLLREAEVDCHLGSLHANEGVICSERWCGLFLDEPFTIDRVL